MTSSLTLSFFISIGLLVSKDVIPCTPLGQGTNLESSKASKQTQEFMSRTTPFVRCSVMIPGVNALTLTPCMAHNTQVPPKSLLPLHEGAG